MSQSTEISKFLEWIHENSESILDSAPCGYIFTLLDGTIVKTNQIVSVWTGLSKTQLISQTKFRDLLTGGGKLYFETNCGPRLQLQGQLTEISLDIKNLNGELTPTLLNSEVLKDARGQAFLLRHTLFPISDRQKYERELLIERRKSEATVQELRDEQMLREKFVATLTHDLRTPITSVQMSAQIILRKISEADPVRPLVSRIVTSVARLDRMIQDLLDANRIRSGEVILLQKEMLDLPSLVHDTLEDLISVHGPRFVYKGPETLEGYWNAAGLRRVVENLCNNALKYGAADELIDVGVNVLGAGVVISVHNFGNPISEKEQEVLFEIYKRTDSASRGGQKGWGLGLTLVQGVVQAHSGTVTVESSEKSGTLFSVYLPLDSRVDGYKGR